MFWLPTANYRGNIPEALKDRMEIIEVPGYTLREKRSIAEQFLVPKQVREHGLTADQLTFEREGIELIINSYTREAGVRGLEREIAAVCRDVTVKLAEGKSFTQIVVNPEHVRELLGPERNLNEVTERRLAPVSRVRLVGVGYGGDILIIEATRMPGKGDIRVTGGLRDVMKESVATAVSYVRSKAERLKLDPEWLKTIDPHLHVPRGGWLFARRRERGRGHVRTSACCLRRFARCRRRDRETALRGNILPVTGIRDQVLVARHRAGIREILPPTRNERDLEEVLLWTKVKNDLRVHFVSRVDEVLALVLRAPEPKGSDDDREVPQSGGEAHP